MAFNNELTRRVVLDLETVGCPEAKAFLDPVSAPANYKDEKKIAEYCAEKSAEQVQRAALEPDLCEIVAIATQVEGGEIVALTREDASEIELIQQVWREIVDRTVLGFNVLGFDLPVLIRRSQLLGLRHPMLNLDRYKTPHIDLLERLSFNGKLKYRSLGFYARRFGIPTEDTTKGADIARMVADGDWQGVNTHVRCDVATTTALAQRLGYLTVPVEAVA